MSQEYIQTDTTTNETEVSNDTTTTTTPETEVSIDTTQPNPVTPTFQPTSYAEAIVGDKIIVTSPEPSAKEAPLTTIPAEVDQNKSAHDNQIPHKSSSQRRVNSRPRPNPRRGQRPKNNNPEYQHAYEEALHWLVTECSVAKEEVQEMVDETRYIIDERTGRPSRSVRVVTLSCDGDNDNIDPKSRHLTRKEKLALRTRNRATKKLGGNVTDGKVTDGKVTDGKVTDGKATELNLEETESNNNGETITEASVTRTPVEGTSNTESVNTDDLLADAKKKQIHFQFQKSRFWKSKSFRDKVVNYYRPQGYYVKIYTYQAGRRGAIDICW